MLRTVKLYGVLRKRFGREYTLDVRNTKEAIHALCCMLPGFQTFLKQADKKGLTFAIFDDKKNLSEEELKIHKGKGIIRIAPIIMGSKSGGLFQTILGAILIVVGAWTGATFLIAPGIALAAGGLVQMLTKTPGMVKGNDQDGNSASYAFGGAITTTAQGNPVGMLYGRREIGGAVISASIVAEDQL